jgi:hypothetical protein
MLLMNAIARLIGKLRDYVRDVTEAGGLADSISSENVLPPIPRAINALDSAVGGARAPPARWTWSGGRDSAPALVAVCFGIFFFRDLGGDLKCCPGVTWCRGRPVVRRGQSERSPERESRRSRRPCRTMRIVPAFI